MKKFLFICTLGVLMCGCTKAVENSENQVGYMTSDTTYNLIAYYPHQATMDLVCEQMPNSTDTNVIFCAEAAFTGQLLDTFSHHNIMGPHVCHGVRYNGYAYNQNYGLFAAYNDQWRIAELPNDALLDSVVQYAGMAFTQYWVIKNGQIYPKQAQKNVKCNYYRVIADVRGELCIIDSKKNISYGLFLKALMKYGVTNALYMDMGPGWNHSFWRDSVGDMHEIHPYKHPYCTNWFTIYK